MKRTLAVAVLAAGLTLTGGTAASAVEGPVTGSVRAGEAVGGVVGAAGASTAVLGAPAAAGGVLVPAWGPECPEAWAALYGWAAANSAICAGYGLLGPAGALGCWAVMVGIGAGLPFNNACD